MTWFIKFKVELELRGPLKDEERFLRECFVYYLGENKQLLKVFFDTKQFVN